MWQSWMGSEVRRLVSQRKSFFLARNAEKFLQILKMLAWAALAGPCGGDRGGNATGKVEVRVASRWPVFGAPTLYGAELNVAFVELPDVEWLDWNGTRHILRPRNKTTDREFLRARLWDTMAVRCSDVELHRCSVLSMPKGDIQSMSFAMRAETCPQKGELNKRFHHSGTNLMSIRVVLVLSTTTTPSPHSCELRLLSSERQLTWPIARFFDQTSGKQIKVLVRGLSVGEPLREAVPRAVLMSRPAFHGMDASLLSFIGVHAFAQTMVGQMGAQGAKETLPLVQEEIINILIEAAPHHLIRDLSSAVSARIPGQVVGNAQSTIRKIIISRLPDLVARKVTEDLKRLLPSDMNQYLVNEISERIIPELHRDLDSVLFTNVSLTLARDMPRLLARSLRVALVKALTWTITHALVPAIVMSLTRDNNMICLSCRTAGTGCNACHASRQGMYYSIWHATYYSDYYGGFYAQYAAQAGAELNKASVPDESKDFHYAEQWSNLEKDLTPKLTEDTFYP